MKRIILSSLFALFVLTLSAADSIEVRGFWMRYSKPKTIAVDTARANDIARANAKRVRFIYDVDFYSYFDNREYHDPYQTPQTIFNFRLAPEVGVQIRDLIGGTHRLIAGVNYTQRLGGDWNDVQFDPTAYYHYKYKGVNLRLGAIPFAQRLHALPDFLLYDSIGYFHPNIQGALFSYQDHRGYAEFMCDWRGAQETDCREMFRIVVDGRYQYKWFNIGGFVQLNHKANPKAPTPREGVCDDFYVSPQIGFDFTDLLSPIDSFSVTLGYVLGIQNDRTAEIYKKPQGFTADLYFNWWFLGVHNRFYYGDCMMPNYGKWGHFLNQGDPFYQSKIYNRLDIFAYIYRNSFVNCYLSYNLHYDGETLQHQQQLNVRFLLSGLKSKKPLRNIFEK